MLTEQFVEHAQNRTSIYIAHKKSGYSHLVKDMQHRECASTKDDETIDLSQE
jgi:hypothetical protein